METLLNVQVYSYDADTDSYELEHIPQSPFLINLQTQKVSDYCEQVDIIAAGFGYTKRSSIIEQPSQVVSGELFTIKVAAKNIWYKQFVQSNFDPINDLFVLEFTPEDDNSDLNV